MPFEPKRVKGLPPLPKIYQMAILVDDKNFSQLDMYTQIILRELPGDLHANLAAAFVAKHFDLYEHFITHFQKAQGGDRSLTDLSNDLHIDIDSWQDYQQKAIQQKKTQHPQQTSSQIITAKNKIHLIKAWGFGFGSEMIFLMAQAYLAEILDRTPVVHWGENFLYRNLGNECVFAHFFKPFNELSIQTIIQAEQKSIFPPKWNCKNLLDENVQKKTGAFSKMSALHYLQNDASVTIADYFSGVLNIKPWLPKGHKFNKWSLDETYRYLMAKYLKPQNRIQEIADKFVHNAINTPFIAVHARGSDKDEGYRAMTSIPMQTLTYAKKRLLELPDEGKLFLMTDDEKLLDRYQAEFGNRLITTNSQRSSTEVGVHYNPSSNKRTAGEEMLVDMLIASKADCFIGLGLSNPSQLICYIGNFQPENYILFGENRLKQFNTHLYKTVPVN